MVIEIRMKLCVTERDRDVAEKLFLPPKLGKRPKNVSKAGFFLNLLKNKAINPR